MSDRTIYNIGLSYHFSTYDARVIRRARRVVTLEDGQIVSDVLQKKSQEIMN